MTGQTELFAGSSRLEPDGLTYAPGFLAFDEEAALVRLVEGLPLAPMRYKDYDARRRVVSYGGKFDFDTQALVASDALAPELHPLRDKVAAWAALAPADLAHVLVAEYAPGTPLGWHRDVPEFEDIIGISLLNDAVMRFRPYPPGADWQRRVRRLVLAPRSIYRLSGPARWAWQHSVVATKTLRYSITFRTRR